MGKMKLTKEEQDCLKVGKMLTKSSNETLNRVQSQYEKIENTLKEHDDFLSEVERELGIDTKNITPKYETFHREAPNKDAWNRLAKEASEEFPGKISFEDVLSSDEIANVDKMLKKINKEFAEKTGLKKIDIEFMMIAVGLQCLRQYVLDPLIKKHRKSSSINDEKGRKGNADPGWYYVETSKILTNRVPFDCNRYSTNSTARDFLKGADHRTMTLGHDPVFGWLFGTANIMTNTMTRTDFASAHIKYEEGRGNTIHSYADTVRMLKACLERITQTGTDGWIALGSAILREGIHLKSDIGTKASLPISGVATLSPELAKILADYGINTASVLSEIGISEVINIIISMVHRLFYDGSTDIKLFEVRTRKIIMYSNLIASTSNVIATAISGDYSKLDIGGILVTLVKLFKNVNFIIDVKNEFLNAKIDEHYEGTTKELKEIYEQYYGETLH